MKQYLCLITILFSSYTLKAQSGSWVWLKGENTGASFGNYGTKGVSSATNEPPARYQAAYWTGKNGNFWLFGGVNGYNDLWKYNPITNEWTWVKGPQLKTSMSGVYGTMGVPSSLNNPPALGYGSNCWTDSTGDFWLFSGYDLSSFVENDVLWRYHIASNEWTWMKGFYSSLITEIYGPKGVEGSTYTPGPRAECKSAWLYDNKLWLFGGQFGAASSTFYKNDLWSYNLSTNNWAWESGTSLRNDMGNYGIKGVANASNVPSSRATYTRWQDGYNNFYLFAGGRVDVTGAHNDVWKYSHSSKLWTWISGTNIMDNQGTINPYCDPDNSDIPASRIENQTAQTNSACTKAFWSFGGFSDMSAKVWFNDLWLFNTTNLEWTKVKGSAGSPPSFSYGTKGVPNASNLLPSRGGSCVWTDKTGSLYTFGGYGNLSSGFVLLNDLWKFIPDTACFRTGIVGSLELIPPSDSLLCGGDTLKMSLPLNCTIDVKPLTGARINTGTNQIEFFGLGTTKYTVIAAPLNPDDPCFKADTISFTIKGFPGATPDFSISPGYAYINSPTFNFLNKSKNAVRYEWFYKGKIISTDIDFVYDFPSIGEHCVTLVSINNCGKRDSVTKCCYVIDTTKIRAILDTTICLGDTVRVKIPLGVKVFINPDVEYTIDSIGQTVKFYPKASAIYTLITKSTAPPSLGLKNDTVTININVSLEPDADFIFNPTRIYTENPNTLLVNQSKNAVRYEWYNNGQRISTDKDLNRTFADLGEYCYTLVAINGCGQRDSLTQCCTVYVKGKLSVPNAFTPNGDSKNDLFRAIVSSPIQKFSLLIVNRYGQEIFKTDNPYQAWDGRFNSQDQEVGVYFYLIKVKFDYPDAAEEMYKGDINLLR